MGTDTSVVQAARVSYGQGTKTPEEDARLVKYLMKNKHSSPFEMCEIKLHVRVPIFIARQWHRHRTASINEISGRYTELKPEVYIPNLEHMCGQSRDNRQGREEPLPVTTSWDIQQAMYEHTNNTFYLYQTFIDAGLSRELARIIVPLNTYTEFYWKIDLHNLFHFLTLRYDHHAQWEIRQYAKAIMDIVASWVPISYNAYLATKESLVS